MEPAVFAEFLKRQGHHIIETESCFWYNAQFRFYFYFPYHRLITPTREELNRLLWGESLIGMRYFTPSDGYGKESYLIVCSDKDYDITSVDAKYARRQTRRGLENFEIRQFDFAELVTLGSKTIRDTLIRQGRDPNTWEDEKWQLYCSAANGLCGFEVWGAFKEGNLAAFIVGFQMEDHYTILHHSSATDYLRLYSNNALVFKLTKLKLSSPKVNHVFYGPASLDAPESLDKFKFRMGFKKRPMKQRIVFNPLLKPLVNTLSYKSIQKISATKPESDLWRKLEGIFRFYLQAS